MYIYILQQRSRTNISSRQFSHKRMSDFCPRKCVYTILVHDIKINITTYYYYFYYYTE